MESERALLAAARAGDADAFARLVGPLRREVHAHCYRMLGSVHDADDVLQETLVRAWRALDRFDGRGPIRPWLHTIAARRCLTAIEHRARRELPVDLATATTPDSELAWLEPYPDAGPEDRYLARESVELAVVAALQRVAPLPRAVLVLRDVLGFPARDVAVQLEVTVATVTSALQRARGAVARRRGVPSDPGEDPRARATARRFADAWEAGDVDGLVALLTEDARYSMPPLHQWYAGRAAIRAFLRDGPLHERWRALVTIANGQPALGTYMADDERGCFVPVSIDVLTVHGDEIAEVVSFLTATDMPAYALPATLPLT